MVPIYFKDVQNGELFMWKGEAWIKIVPTTYFVIGRDLSQKVYDEFMKDPPNAFCPEPYNEDELNIARLQSNDLVELTG